MFFNISAHRRIVAVLLCALLALPLLSGFASPAPPDSLDGDAVEAGAAFRALQRLERYLAERSATLGKGWIFGPNLDDTYYYRIRFFDTQEVLRDVNDSPQREAAIAAGIPLIEEIAPAERLAMMLANYRGRRTSVRDSLQFICVKHFPGGSRLLESTEGIEYIPVFRETPKEWEPRLDVFRRVCRSPHPPHGVMTSHAAYPELEKALRRRHPDLTPLVPSDSAIPGTFSPALLRGLLRRELGYQGPVVTDWMDMGAVNRFLLDTRPDHPKAMTGLSDDAKIMVFAIKAGCHFVTGMQNRPKRAHKQKTMEAIVQETATFAAGFPGFADTVRTIAQESVSWFAAPPFFVPSRTLPSVPLSIEDCLRFILGEPIRAKDYLWLNRFSPVQFQDLWNRQGLLQMQMRLFYLQERYGLAAPTLPWRNEDERVVASDRNLDWLDSVKAMPNVMNRYKQVLWLSPQSDAAWAKALERWSGGK